MGLLGILDLGRVLLRAWREVALTVRRTDRRPHCHQRFARHHDVVRTHIGDVAALVQSLGDAHDLRRRQAQFATTLLLQRRRHERRLRRRTVRTLLDRTNGEGRVVQPVDKRSGQSLVDDDNVLLRATDTVEVLAGRDFDAVEGAKRRRERRRCCREQADVPVPGGAEGDAFAFTFDDQADQWTLHPAGRQTAIDAAPQHRRNLVPIEAVEDAAGLGGVDKAVVDAARVVDRMVDRRLGDLVKNHPLDRNLRLQIFEQVPRNGLPLTIFVRCQIELACILQRHPQVLDDVFPAHRQLICRLETVVDIDRQTLARQVRNVADGGAHVVRTAEEFRDGLGLGRRFDDDERFGHGVGIARPSEVALSSQQPKKGGQTSSGSLDSSLELLVSE